MFVDQQLSEEARTRAEAAAASANAKQQVAPSTGRPEHAPLCDSELVPARPELNMALEAARDQRAQEEDAIAMETLNPHKPTLAGWWRAWELTKRSIAVLTILPIRLAIMAVGFGLMTIVAAVVMLIGCFSCRCPSSSSLSAKTKNCPQRAVMRLVSPLARLVLFSLGFIYIREHRVENDFHTPRLRRHCWQCRPSRKVQSAAAGSAAIATAVASRSGSNFRPGASTSTPQRRGEATHTSGNRHRIDAVAAAHGSTIIANHSSIADALYIAWRYPATAVASDYFKFIPCFWVIGNAIGVLFLSGHTNAGARTGTGATEAIVQYQQAAAVEQGHHLRRLLVFPEGTTTNGRQVLQFRCAPSHPDFSMATACSSPQSFSDNCILQDRSLRGRLASSAWSHDVSVENTESSLHWPIAVERAGADDELV